MLKAHINLLEVFYYRVCKLRGYRANVLGVDVEVLEFQSSVDTVEKASQLSGYEPGKIVKTLLLKAGGEYIVALVRGDRKLDLNLLSKTLGVEVSLAKAKEVKEVLKVDVGGVTPLSEEVLKLKIFLDEGILENEYVVCGGGDRRKLYKVKTEDLIRKLKPTLIQLT